MNVYTKGDYFLSIGSKSHSKQYRVYLLDYEGNVAYNETVKNEEFIFCKLKQE